MSEAPEQAPAAGIDTRALMGDLRDSAIRHGASYVAGMLVSVGAISGDQRAQAVSVLMSVMLWAVAQTWSFAQKTAAHRKAAGQ